MNFSESKEVVPNKANTTHFLIGSDQATTENFVRSNTGWMLAVAKRIVPDAAAAEDVVQEAFANVFSNLESFKGDSTLKTWIHRIVVNQALMALRKQRRRKEQPIEELLPQFDEYGCRINEPSMLSQLAETPEAQLMSSDRRQQVLSNIQQLPENYRIVVMLRDIEELSTSEVAEATGLSKANVKVRLHRARAALKKLLSPIFEGPEL